MVVCEMFVSFGSPGESGSAQSESVRCSVFYIII